MTKPRHTRTVQRNPEPVERPESLVARWGRFERHVTWYKPDADLLAGIDEAYRAKRREVEARERAAAITATEAHE